MNRRFSGRTPGPRPGERRAPDPLEILTTDELAAWFRVSPRTITRQFTHVPGMPARYLVSDVLEQIKAKKEKAA